MADKPLSQEEIDAILTGQGQAEQQDITAEAEAGAEVAAEPEAASVDATSDAPVEISASVGADEGISVSEASDGPGGAEGAASLNEEQMDALGEFFNIAMGKAATVLSANLNFPVEISTPSVDIGSWDKICESHPVPSLLVTIKYKEGFEGDNLLVVEQRDAIIIANLMEEEEPLTEIDGELDEYRRGTVAEAMNQMVGGASGSMSEMIGRPINISPPSINPIDLREDLSEIPGSFGIDQEFLQIAFKFVVEGLVNSEMLQLVTSDFAARLANELLDDNEDLDVAAPEPGSTPSPAPQAQADVVPARAAPPARPSEQRPAEPALTVGRAEFQPLRQSGAEPDSGGNYQIIMDVELDISVELGRTRMRVKDVLALGEGAIIELDKIVGEPVEIFANERLIARGEVVVIEEDFGVRITEVVKKTEVRGEIS